MRKVKQCFLIDDDVDDQEIFQLALQQLDTPVDCEFASDAIEALNKFKGDRSFVPDHIFIDVNMPRMNGVECLKEIKKLNHLKDVEIFMYSTSSDHKIINATSDLGAQFIIKPTSIDSLVSILSESLKISDRS